MLNVYTTMAVLLKDPRYLMGVEETKSEIIVPIFAGGVVAAEFDINSFFKDTWTKEEVVFVERCAALVAGCL